MVTTTPVLLRIEDKYYSLVDLLLDESIPPFDLVELFGKKEDVNRLMDFFHGLLYGIQHPYNPEGYTPRKPSEDEYLLKLVYVYITEARMKHVLDQQQYLSIATTRIHELLVKMQQQQPVH